jgi:hypothetical protein
VSGCWAGRGNEPSDMSRNWRFLGTARAVIGAMFQEPVSPVSPGTFFAVAFCWIGCSCVHFHAWLQPVMQCRLVLFTSLGSPEGS